MGVDFCMRPIKGPSAVVVFSDDLRKS